MYNELYELWKKEKENEKTIQRLPKNFYAQIADYIKKTREENRMLDKKTTKAKLLDAEFKNVKIMAGELFELRCRKLWEKALARETFGRDVLTEEEKKLCDVLPLAEAYHAFSRDVLRGRLSFIEKGAKQRFMVLRFVQSIPALVGSDMKTYGPFEPEDIATLPPENARILIKQGVAVEVDSK
jgi:DNA replication factor GINS